MKTLSLPVFLLICILFTAVKASGDPINTYSVRIDKNNLRVIYVEATIHLTDKRLSMDWPSANSVENGWAHFVKNLSVFDKSGQRIEVSPSKKATWSLQTEEKKVSIRYEVLINHDKIEWTEGGHSAAAYVVDGVVYMIGAAFFIAPPSEMKIGAGSPAHISFDLPKEYDMVVPWTRIEAHTYRVKDTYELVRSALLLGGIKKSSLSLQGMEVEIATSPDFRQAMPIFQAIYEEIVPATLDYFGSKAEGKYVVIANKAPRTDEFGPYFSGEALHQSMSIISPIIPTEEYMPIFWYILTHEYLHIWNGITIRPVSEERETWFFEGFTDYIAWGILYRLGKLPQELMLNGFGVAGNSTGWGENIKKYLAVAGEKNFREAGFAKQENYDLIYSGGSLFALVLDIEMNEKSKGEAGVRDLMQALNQRFGKGTGKILTYADLHQIASDLCGANLVELFDKYVQGKSVIPVSEYLEKAGLLIEDLGKANQQIILNKEATPTQKMILKAISGIAQD